MLYLIPGGTSKTALSAPFWSRTTVDFLLLYILLFFLLLPLSEMDRCGRGNAATEDGT